jgi:hypothetical protein
VHRKAVAFCVGLIATGAVSFLTAMSAGSQPPRSIDDARAKSAGIRKLSGRHLTLYTDVPSSPEIDRLPAIFDQAVPQWAAYFGVPESKTQRWHATGYLIADRRRFDALGLMPAGNDNFINGISLGSELWLYDQPSDYYRRHLLLHEGTHVFMTSLLGGCGPGWYMEGTAELFATHRLDEQTGQLMLRIMPVDRAEVPMLGRIKLIEDARDAGRTLTLREVLQFDNRQQLGNEAYAWCWAAAKFLDSHPQYQERFHDLKKRVLEKDFNQRLKSKFPHWSRLEKEWKSYIAALDYGYDFDRMVIGFQRGKELGIKRNQVSIAADRGWQSSGIALEKGRTYRITAEGQYQIATEVENGDVHPWPCEPGGVTLQYHNGQPLGILLGAIDSSLDKPFAIGLEKTLSPSESGTLYLRVNDSAGHLADNRGKLTVTIEAETAKP